MGEIYHREQEPVLAGDAVSAADDAQQNTPNASGMLKRNPALLFLAVLFLFGLLLGSLFITKADSTVLDALDYLFFSSIRTRASDALLTVFIASMTSSFLFIVMSWFCGLSMWGSILIPVLPLLRGFGLGMTAGYVYSYGGSGILYYILLILPGAFLSILSILFSAIEGIRFSKQINAFHKANAKLHTFAPQPSVRNYTVRFAIITILAIGAALLDLFTAFLFSGLFQELIQ